jgi:tetratricopeptide (TPR) repeat protein
MQGLETCRAMGGQEKEIIASNGSMGQSASHARDQYNRGVAFARKNEMDEAIECFQKALELDPGFALAQKSLGSALASIGKFEQAIDAYREALAQFPNEPGLHYKLALVLMQKHKTGEAIQHLRRTLELNPKHTQARKKLNALTTKTGAGPNG